MQIVCDQRPDHYKPFPRGNPNIDSYRGLTVMTRLHEKYYPTPESVAKKLVDMKTRQGQSHFIITLFKTNEKFQNRGSLFRCFEAIECRRQK